MNDSKQQSTFLLHDYETFGMHSTLDRPTRFTAIRTDSEFNVIGEPEVFYCKPVDDYLPQPGAVSVTGIASQEAQTKGGNEAIFATRIHSLFTTPKTCILGYNNMCSDDKVTRNVFYHNFYDPYAWNWQYDNSHRGLLDVMCAYYALRPEGINWPENNDDLPSFCLEHLTEANGIEHSNAHNAMTDVCAAIMMAKLVETRQPHLFDYLFIRRSKYKLMALINVPQMKPLVHASGIFEAWRGSTSWVIPLAWHPENRNAVIVADLTGDIPPLLELNSDTLREYLYTAKADFGDNAAALVKLVHINKCPVLAQANTLRPENAGRLGINRQHYLDNLKILHEDPQVREKVVATLTEAKPFTPSENVDAQFYNDFLSDADRTAMKIALGTEPRNLPALDITFANKQIEGLLFNYRTRGFPGTLDYVEQQRWLEHHRQVPTLEFLQSYADELRVLTQQYVDDREKVVPLKAL